MAMGRGWTKKAKMFSPGGHTKKLRVVLPVTFTGKEDPHVQLV
jgi:hypothetical protein